MNLSTNVTLKEMTHSDKAIEKGIINNYSVIELIEMVRVSNMVVQPIRDNFKVPMRITSGYRNVEICEAIGSSKTSNHTKGGTVDLEAWNGDVPNAEILLYALDNLPIREIIAENLKIGDSTAGWCHIQVAPIGYINGPICKVKDSSNNYTKMSRYEFKEYLQKFTAL